MFKIYMRLLGFARPIRKYAIPYFFYSLFYALFNSLTFLLIMPILKTMFDADYTFVYVEKLPPLAFNQEYLTALFNFTYSHLFNEYNPENVLLLLAIVTIFVSLLSNLFRYMGAWTVENMRTRTLQRMRNEMFSKVVDMNVGYFSDQRKGDIISKITSDVGVVQFCITNTLQVAFREPFLIIGYTVMMVAISWELALFSVLFLPVVALIIGSIVKRLRHPARTSQQRMGELVSTLDESLSGIKVIKSYNATGYVKQKFYDLSEDLARLTLSMARRQQLASPMSEFLGISAVGVILVFGGSLVFKDALSPEGFIAFIAMFSQITRPVRTFIDQFSNINQGIAAGERIFSIIDALNMLEGAFAFLIMTANRIYACRDKYGLRPLSIGKLGDGWVVSSETCAFDVLGAEFVRDVEPGEIVTIDKQGIRSRDYSMYKRHEMCSMEYIYFARPDSDIDGCNVHAYRKESGRLLWKEAPAEADIVVGVPDSSLSAAMGYAEASGLPYEMGLIKNKYIGRTFIQPSQELREKGVRMKLSAVRSIVRGKRVVLVDDSIVRGTTSRRIVTMLKEAGATEVHVRIASPPMTDPCFYGVDTSTREELISARKNTAGVCEEIGADSLVFLSPESLLKAGSRKELCMACFTGQYPTALYQSPEEANKDVKC